MKEFLISNIWHEIADIVYAQQKIRDFWKNEFFREQKASNIQRYFNSMDNSISVWYHYI